MKVDMCLCKLVLHAYTQHTHKDMDASIGKHAHTHMCRQAHMHTCMHTHTNTELTHVRERGGGGGRIHMHA